MVTRSTYIEDTLLFDKAECALTLSHTCRNPPLLLLHVVIFNRCLGPSDIRQPAEVFDIFILPTFFRCVEAGSALAQ